MILPAGFVRNIRGENSGNTWDHIYQTSYFFGFFVALICFWGFHTIWPVSRQTGSSPFVLEQYRRRVHRDRDSAYESSVQYSQHADGAGTVTGLENEKDDTVIVI
jgi:NCS1 family nucleobase:cation symporter-1